jgi:hypothetical protein
MLTIYWRHQGKFQDVCRFSCDNGYVPFGEHVCGGDGYFKGGMCAVAGSVPVICGSSAGYLANNDGTGLDAHDDTINAMHMRLRVAFAAGAAQSIPAVDLGAVADHRGLTSLRKKNVTAYIGESTEECVLYDFTLADFDASDVDAQSPQRLRAEAAAARLATAEAARLQAIEDERQRAEEAAEAARWTDGALVAAGWSQTQIEAYRSGR